MKKRVVLGLSLVLLLAPVALVLLVPEWRERAHDRWLVHKLRSDDAETRKLVIAALLARGRPDIDDIFPEVVAAAVANVTTARSVIVGKIRDGGRHGRGPKSIKIDMGSLHFTAGRSWFEVERALSATPEQLFVDEDRVLFQSDLFRSTNRRALIVAEDGKIVILVPLEGELGERILSAVEQRLHAMK